MNVLLVEYDTQWVAIFERIEKQMRDVLGSSALMIEHVGSTSILGLAAKPVIDVILVVASSADEAAYLPALIAVGFTLQLREPNWFEHRLVRAPDCDSNIHVFSVGCNEIDRMLLFRDWLRANEDDKRLYERSKRELAKRTWATIQDYADAKSQVVAEILARARASNAGAR